MSQRELLFVLVIALVGALGAWPGTRARSDPIALLSWLSVWSLPAGFVCGARGVALWPLAAVVPAAWMLLVGAVDGASARDLPTPVWAALAWSALFTAGFACGRLAARWLWSGFALALLACAALSALPIEAGALGMRLSPALRARLLDLSPTSFVLECAGLDWMRHPAVYDSVDTSAIDPGLRSAWRGALAAPVALVAAGAFALGAAASARALQRRSGYG